MDSDGGVLVIRQSRRSALRWLVVTLVLFGFGGILELKDEPVIARIGLVFAVLGTGLFAPGVVRPRSLVLLTPSGLQQSILRPVFVPWSEITDISAVKRELGGAELKSVCVSVRDPDKVVRGTSRWLWHAAQTRWWSPIFKLIYGAFLLAVEGPKGVADLKDVAKSDVKLRGIVEIPSTRLPMSADDLVALLRQWQQRYRQGPATNSRRLPHGSSE
jgi:hypothetical protein